MKTRFEGIDYLRAIMSVFVVLWHMNAAGRSLIFSADKYKLHEFTLSDLVNFNLLLLAVPTFFLISNFLYAQGEVNRTSLQKRLKRIFTLLVFWPITYIIFDQSFVGLSFLIPQSYRELVIIILTAGDTIYYFFVSLIICLLLTHLIARLSLWLQILGFFTTALLLASLPIITIFSGIYQLSAFWNPLNFIPYSFAAVLISQNLGFIQTNKKILLSASIILWIVISLFEWRYFVGAIFQMGSDSAIPAYTRSSLLFGAIACFILATSERAKSNKTIKFMSKYSLSLYCLHIFMMNPITRLLNGRIHTASIELYVSILLVILLSYLLAVVLNKYFLKADVII